MAINQTLPAAPGDDLRRIAARYYADSTAFTLITFASGLPPDPIITANVTLTIPPYSKTRANSGIPNAQPIAGGVGALFGRPFVIS